MSRRFVFAAALAALFASPVQAFTPESGFYWNRSEPGTGLALEIQDNYVYLTAYVYTPAGQATWFSAQGEMRKDGALRNDYFTAQLDAFSNGQCIGCNFRAPTAQLGAGGPITIEFLSETEANLTWGTPSRTQRIERFDYFLTRGESSDPKTDLMLGEWQVVLDLYDRGGVYRNYPYVGDVMAIETIDKSTTPDQFEGCRPARSTRPGRCTNDEVLNHPVAGFYDAQEKEHIIIVTDVADDDEDDIVQFAYYVDTGTYQFDGVVEICGYLKCGRSGATYYPVRGFRSASRTFVRSGSGPSDNPKAATAPTSLVESLLAAGAGALPQGLTREEVIAQYGIDPTRHASRIAALQRKP